MKLSEKIRKLIQEKMETNGYSWLWMDENTYLVEWLNDAKELENYIKSMKGEQNESIENSG